MLLDTFFDGGGNNNFAVVACGVVSRWLWAAVYMPHIGAAFMVSLNVRTSLVNATLFPCCNLQ